jgi:hypothetical protein
VKIEARARQEDNEMSTAYKGMAKLIIENLTVTHPPYMIE